MRGCGVAVAGSKGDGRMRLGHLRAGGGGDGDGLWPPAPTVWPERVGGRVCLWQVYLRKYTGRGRVPVAGVSEEVHREGEGACGRCIRGSTASW